MALQPQLSATRLASPEKAATLRHVQSISSRGVAAQKDHGPLWRMFDAECGNCFDSTASFSPSSSRSPNLGTSNSSRQASSSRVLLEVETDNSWSRHPYEQNEFKKEERKARISINNIRVDYLVRLVAEMESARREIELIQRREETKEKRKQYEEEMARARIVQSQRLMILDEKKTRQVLLTVQYQAFNEILNKSREEKQHALYLVKKRRIGEQLRAKQKLEEEEAEQKAILLRRQMRKRQSTGSAASSSIVNTPSDAHRTPRLSRRSGEEEIDDDSSSPPLPPSHRFQPTEEDDDEDPWNLLTLLDAAGKRPASAQGFTAQHQSKLGTRQPKKIQTPTPKPQRRSVLPLKASSCLAADGADENHQRQRQCPSPILRRMIDEDESWTHKLNEEVSAKKQQKDDDVEADDVIDPIARLKARTANLSAMSHQKKDTSIRKPSNSSNAKRRTSSSNEPSVLLASKNNKTADVAAKPSLLRRLRRERPMVEVVREAKDVVPATDKNEEPEAVQEEEQEASAAPASSSSSSTDDDVVKSSNTASSSSPADLSQSTIAPHDDDDDQQEETPSKDDDEGQEAVLDETDIEELLRLRRVVVNDGKSWVKSHAKPPEWMTTTTRGKRQNPQHQHLRKPAQGNFHTISSSGTGGGVSPIRRRMEEELLNETTDTSTLIEQQQQCGDSSSSSSTTEEDDDHPDVEEKKKKKTDVSADRDLTRKDRKVLGLGKDFFQISSSPTRSGHQSLSGGNGLNCSTTSGTNSSKIFAQQTDTEIVLSEMLQKRKVRPVGSVAMLPGERSQLRSRLREMRTQRLRAVDNLIADKEALIEKRRNEAIAKHEAEIRTDSIRSKRLLQSLDRDQEIRRQERKIKQSTEERLLYQRREELAVEALERHVLLREEFLGDNREIALQRTTLEVPEADRWEAVLRKKMIGGGKLTSSSSSPPQQQVEDGSPPSQKPPTPSTQKKTTQRQQQQQEKQDLQRALIGASAASGSGGGAGGMMSRGSSANSTAQRKKKQDLLFLAKMANRSAGSFNLAEAAERMSLGKQYEEKKQKTKTPSGSPSASKRKDSSSASHDEQQQPPPSKEEEE